MERNVFKDSLNKQEGKATLGKYKLEKQSLGGEFHVSKVWFKNKRTFLQNMGPFAVIHDS